MNSTLSNAQGVNAEIVSWKLLCSYNSAFFWHQSWNIAAWRGIESFCRTIRADQFNVVFGFPISMVVGGFLS